MIDIGDVDMEPLMVPESWSLRDTLCALSDLGDWFKLVYVLHAARDCVAVFLMITTEIGT